MPKVNAWDVPAGTKKKMPTKRKDFSVIGGAIEHKNRPEAVYITFSSWVKPKLKLTAAKANSTSIPQEIVSIVSKDFEKEVERAGKKFSYCFDSTYFDPYSIIWIVDYAAVQAKVGKRQFFELEINIDTVNTIDNDGQPSRNPANGKIEMYSFKDLEKYIVDAVNKVLNLEVFDEKKSLVTFSTSKGAK